MAAAEHWAAQQEPALWDQQPDEPGKWYGRFLLYLNLGPTRSVGKAQQAYYHKENEPERRLTTGTWAHYVRRWRWRERALAWDLHQRDLLALGERNARHALRTRRIMVIEDYLESVRAALDNARLDEVDEEQARVWLPQLRRFLVDLLDAQRKEFERSNYDAHDQDNDVTITADDLRAAQRMMEQQAQQESPPQPQPQP